jgi:hypothetical protein
MESPIGAACRVPAGVPQGQGQGGGGRAPSWRSRGLIIGTLLATVSIASPVLAKSACRGPLKKSCLRTLYACFNAKGTCMTEEQRGVGSSTATSCWTNGAKLIFELGATTQMGSARVTDAQVRTTNSKGKTCFSGPVVISTAETPPIITTTTWTVARKKKTWELVTDTTGAFDVTCPNGKVEMYTVQELGTLAAQCGGTGGACSPGTCP